MNVDKVGLILIFAYNYNTYCATGAEIDFIAVICVFGFQPNEDISANHIPVADNPNDLIKILI